MKPPKIPPPALACGILTLSSALTAAAAETVGVNFVSNYPTPVLSGELSHGMDNWFDLGPGEEGGSFLTTGTAEVDTHLSVTWHTANPFAAGVETDSEQQLYRVYLDDGDGGGSYQDGDGIGVSVQITGLDAWMTANGLTGYFIRSFHSTDTNSAQFRPVSVREGVPAEEGALADLPEIATITASESGGGYFPSSVNATPSGSRGRGQSGVLTEGAVTLTIPSGGDGMRGTLAGLMLVGVKGDPVLVLPPPLTRPLASTGEFNVPVFNAGPAGTLTVSGATPGGDDAAKFTVLETPGDLAPGESGNIRLAFEAGTATGQVFAVLTVASNDPVAASQEYEIAGQIVDPILVTPVIADFAPGATQIEIPVSNAGRNGALSITEVTLQNDDAGLFSVVEQPDALALAPGAAGFIRVTTSATADQLPATATLRVVSDDPVNPEKFIALRAAAVSEPEKVGINFTSGYEAPSLAGKSPYGTSNWTDLGRTSYTGFNGEFAIRGSALVSSRIGVRWYTYNSFVAGEEADPEQQVYRIYLDDWDGGGSYADGDGIGASVELTGLGAWMTANSFSGYTIRAFRSTDSAPSTFHDISVRRGVPANGSALADLPEIAFITTLPENTGGGFFPTDPELMEGGTRGFGDSGALTEPAITLTLPVNSGNVRGTLAGLILTGIAGQPADPAFAITAFSHDAAGNISVTWGSQAGKTYTVQSSANLTDWTPAASNVAGQAGSTTWTGAVPGAGQRLFLRVTQP